LTVSKTFALAIEEAAKLHPAAAPLIVYASLLAPEPIPLYLFSEASEEFAEPFASSLKDDGLDEAVAALRTFALVDREAIPDERDRSITTDCIRLHRLVRQVAALRCENKSREDAWCALIGALDVVCSDNVHEDPTTWPRARRLDAIVVAVVEDDRKLPQEVEMKVAHLLAVLALHRTELLADYTQARVLCERVLEICERIAGPDSIETASALNALALVVRGQNDSKRALELGERTLAILEKTEGIESSNTLVGVINVARMLQDQGNLTKAFTMYERAVASIEKVLGKENRLMAAALNNLANLLDIEGEKDKARILYERVIEIRERVYDPKHPAIATALGDLGSLFADEGNFEHARPILERALSIDEFTFGPAHPNTIRRRKNLVRMLIAAGRPGEALTICEGLLAAKEWGDGADYSEPKIFAGIAAEALDILGRPR